MKITKTQGNLLKNIRSDIKQRNLSEEKDLECIIEGCKQNDRIFQHKLYKLFSKKMMITCLRYTNNEDEAKDILQDGFIKIFMNIQKYSPSGSFEGWARRIFINLSIDYFRKKQKQNILTDSDYIENIDLKTEIEEEGTKYNFSSEQVMHAIQSLSPVYRTVFNLYVMEGYTHKEIAQILKISEGTSKSNLAKAKANLKKRLTNNEE